MVNTSAPLDPEGKYQPISRINSNIVVFIFLLRFFLSSSENATIKKAATISKPKLLKFDKAERQNHIKDSKLLPIPFSLRGKTTFVDNTTRKAYYCLYHLAIL